MGTNYYVRVEPCEHCGRSDREFHMGKSSVGWSFSFRGYKSAWEGPEPIVSEDEWRDFLQRNPHVIVDEYGKIVDDERFWETVEAKREGINHASRYPDPQHWTDDKGNSFSGEEFC